MTDTIISNNQPSPLLLTAPQAAKLLGIPISSFNVLVKKKLIRGVEGFKNRRRFSEREIIRFAWSAAK